MTSESISKEEAVLCHHIATIGHKVDLLRAF